MDTRPRTERLDVVTDRNAPEHVVLEAARSKIVMLGDHPIEVEIRGRKPHPVNRGQSIWFIRAKVRPL